MGIGGEEPNLMALFQRQKTPQDGPFRHVASGRSRGPRTDDQEQCACQGKNQDVIPELAS
jgi:hypothetical protein